MVLTVLRVNSILILFALVLAAIPEDIALKISMNVLMSLVSMVLHVSIHLEASIAFVLKDLKAMTVQSIQMIVPAIHVKMEQHALIASETILACVSKDSLESIAPLILMNVSRILARITLLATNMSTHTHVPVLLASLEQTVKQMMKIVPNLVV
jgi:hypothetical protein